MAISALFSGLFNIVRLSLYVFLLICGLIVLGLSADIASDTVRLPVYPHRLALAGADFDSLSSGSLVCQGCESLFLGDAA